MNPYIDLVPYVIGLPLLGFLVNGLLGLSSPAWRNQKTLIGTIATLSVFIPFLITVLLFSSLTVDGPASVYTLFTWIQAGTFTSDIAWRVDQLSLIMSLVVTGVGTLIHLYSMGYMKEDEGYWKFFAYLNLFIFAMMNLVMGNNLLLLFLGWEGVGVCSYLLIGFWYGDMAKSSAAKKAFVYNRIGDFAFLIAMFLVFRFVGSIEFDVIFASLHLIPTDVAFWIALLMFIGATGKSAQIPLFVWLPDAMAGPTPVSALIHAATMVTSGIYLIARMSSLYVLAPNAMLIVAIIGALTAVVAATIALTQYDIKRVLAYSTVSQLGFMFLALGSGAFIAAIFHVVTHAFFKACLFLGSGSVIHAMHEVEHKLEHKGKHIHFDPQDMRFMGGLRQFMPHTYKTFLIATIAIAGIPPLAGFFSKDEILAMTVNAGVLGHQPIYFILWAVAMLTAFLTAFYMFRLTFATFHGSFKLPQKFPEAKGSEAYLHESPWTMTLPLWILAGLSIAGGFMGFPDFIVETFTGAKAHANWLHGWLIGVTSEYDLVLAKSAKWLILGASVVVATVASWLAFTMYTDDKAEASDKAIVTRFGGLYTVWSDKYRFDEFYEGYIANPIVKVSDKVLAVFDLKVIDGFVNLTAGTVRFAGSLLRYLQTGVTQSYTVMLVIGTLIVLGMLLFG
jgi:NADH-quinone oxidoreductase subunit L